MFYNIEGEVPKNHNSVCLNLFKLHENMIVNKESTNKNLVLFFDNTCSQNKNWTVLKFLSYISIKFNVNIIHFFPVVVHSYSECDRNFSHLVRNITNKEVIELPNEYIEKIKLTKNKYNKQKFTVLKQKVYNFQDYLQDYFYNNKNIEISKAVNFQYTPTGDIILCNNYNSLNEIIFNLLNCDINIVRNLYIDNNFKILNIGIRHKKQSDIESLYKYLNNHLWYVNLFKSYKTIDIDFCSEDDSDCD